MPYSLRTRASTTEEDQQSSAGTFVNGHVVATPSLNSVAFVGSLTAAHGAYALSTTAFQEALEDPEDVNMADLAPVVDNNASDDSEWDGQEEDGGAAGRKRKQASARKKALAAAASKGKEKRTAAADVAKRPRGRPPNKKPQPQPPAQATTTQQPPAAASATTGSKKNGSGRIKVVRRAKNRRPGHVRVPPRERRRAKSPAGIPKLRLKFGRDTDWNPPMGTFVDVSNVCAYCNDVTDGLAVSCLTCDQVLYCSDGCRLEDLEVHTGICQVFDEFNDTKEPPSKLYYRALLLDDEMEEDAEVYGINDPPIFFVWIKIEHLVQNDAEDSIVMSIAHQECWGERLEKRTDMNPDLLGRNYRDRSSLPGIKQITLNDSRQLFDWHVGHGLAMVSLDREPYKPITGAGYEADPDYDREFPHVEDQANMTKGDPNPCVARLHLPGAVYIPTGPRLIFAFAIDASGNGQKLLDFHVRDYRFVADYFRNSDHNPRINDISRSFRDAGLPALQIMDLGHPMTKTLGITETFHEILAPRKSRWDDGLGYCLIPYYLGLPWIFRPGPLTAKSMSHGYHGSVVDLSHGVTAYHIFLGYCLQPIKGGTGDGLTHWTISRHSQHESMILIHASLRRTVHPLHVEALVEYLRQEIVEPQIRYDAHNRPRGEGMWMTRGAFVAFWVDFATKRGVLDEMDDPWEGSEDPSHFWHHDELTQAVAERQHKLWFHQRIDNAPGVGYFGPGIGHAGDKYGDLNVTTRGEPQRGNQRQGRPERDWFRHHDRQAAEDAEEKKRAWMAKDRRGGVPQGSMDVDGGDVIGFTFANGGPTEEQDVIHISSDNDSSDSDGDESDDSAGLGPAVTL